MVRSEVFGNPHQQKKPKRAAHCLKKRGPLERAQPSAEHRPCRKSAPDAAAHIPQRLRAAFRSRELHCPCRCTCVKTGLTEPLNTPPNPDSGQPERQQINYTGECAASEPGKKRNLPPASIRERP